MLFYLLNIHTRALKYITKRERESWKTQFSHHPTDGFLVTNQIIYTHSEQGTLTSKGFNFLTAARGSKGGTNPQSAEESV